LTTVLHDCAVCLPTEEAVAIIDSALVTGRIQDLGQVVSAGPHESAVRRVVALVDPAAQSVLESVARVSLLLDGVRDLVSQVRIDRVGWVDLVVAGWLVIDLDGWAYHRDAFHEDRRRDAELTRRGYVVLRFTYADLVSRRAWFLATVRETLDRGHPPFAWVS
jgi:very-short-patch-repair endonuclease